MPRLALYSAVNEELRPVLHVHGLVNALSQALIISGGLRRRELLNVYYG